MDESKERLGKFVVSGSDTSKMLNFIEKTFHQMTFLIQVPVNIPRIDCINFGRNCVSRVFTRNIVSDVSRAIRPVPQNIASVNLQFGKQRDSFLRIMNLSAGQAKSDRIAKSVNNSMDFRVFPASACAYILVFI